MSSNKNEVNGIYTKLRIAQTNENLKQNSRMYET